MKKIKSHKNRLKITHKRYPWNLVLKNGEGNAKCKYCGRTPLVSGFDMVRTIEGKDQFSCLECYQADRTSEDRISSLGRLGMALSGLREEEEFPLAPEKGTPHRTKTGGNCATCRKPIYYNPYKKKLIGAYNELLRGITVHKKCGIK